MTEEPLEAASGASDPVEETAAATPAAPSSVRLRSFAFLAGAFGGFMIALGALMPWARITPAFESDRGLFGIDLWEGIAVLVAGVLIVLATFALRFQATYERRRLTCIAMMALAVFAAGVTASVMVRSNERVMDQTVNAKEIADETGVPMDEAMKMVIEGRSVEFRTGVWMVFVGAVIALIGAFMCLHWAKKRAAAAVAEGRRFGARKADGGGVDEAGA